MVEPTSPGRQRPPLLPGPNSLASTSTASILISDAPTPNNTYFSPDASARDSDDGSSTKEMMIHDDGGGDVSLRPSLTPTSTSTHPGLSSRVPSTFSSHASSYLLPTPSSTSFDTQSIPFSTRPVPAAPLSFRSSNKYTSATTDLTTPTLESAPPSIAIDAVKLGDNASDLEASTSRGSRGGGFKQEDVDAQRLQQLGYDAVLGRDYTFWSSLSISWLNIGCLQVSRFTRFRGLVADRGGQGTIYAVSGVYSYGGPAMIVRHLPSGHSYYH